MNEWLLVVALALAYLLYKILQGHAPYIPLPMETVRKILKIANVRKGDVVYDLGSGDGRVVMEAARLGARAVGVENNALFVWISRFRVKRAGFGDRVKIVRGDIFKQRLSGADVVVMYLTQKTNDRIKSKLERELKKGTRVISADHIFKGWKPVKRIKTGHFYTYLYRV